MLKVISNMSVHAANPACLICLVRLYEEDYCLMGAYICKRSLQTSNDETTTHVGLVRSLTPAVNHIPTERQENHT
jgi:hypothetical protein